VPEAAGGTALPGAVAPIWLSDSEPYVQPPTPSAGR